MSGLSRENNDTSSTGNSVEQMNKRFAAKEQRNIEGRHIGDLAEYTPGTVESQNVEHRLLSEVRVKKIVQEEWPDNPEYHKTNAFGLPKKMSPSAAIKQEWPPREEIIQEPTTEVGEVINESKQKTNVLGLPKDWAESRAPIKKEFTQMPPSMVADGEEKTNALGIPLHWFEKKLAEEEEANRKKEEVPVITPEEIEKIKQDAYNEGFQSGVKDGFSKGHEEGLAVGNEEGFAAGQKDGYEAGIAQAQAQMADKIEFFGGIAEKLAHPLAELDNSVASSLLDLAIRLTKQMVTFEVDSSKQYVLTALHQAIEMLPVVNEGITITVNNHDATILLESYLEEDRQKEGWEVKVDDSLQNGDLIVSARDSEITMKLSDQIDSLIREFIRANFS